jgi:hypothetical protein
MNYGVNSGKFCTFSTTAATIYFEFRKKSSAGLFIGPCRMRIITQLYKAKFKSKPAMQTKAVDLAATIDGNK